MLGGGHFEILRRPPAQDAAEEEDESGGKQQQRPEPQQQRRELERRTIQDEVAVTGDHVVDDFRVARAPSHLLPYLVPEILGERRVRIGEGLVLADETAQLG